MSLRRVFQCVLGAAGCAGIGYWLGPAIYFIVAVVVTAGVLVAFWRMSWGWMIFRDLTVAFSVGLVWPILIVAFFVHSTRITALKALDRDALTSEPGLRGVEDLEKRERRDQR